jgi:hypothetical protein
MRLNLSLAVIAVVGVLLREWHFQIGLQGVCVLWKHEPVSSWLALFTGFLLMLPATLLALATARLAAWVLLTGSMSSTIATGVQDHEVVLPAMLMLSGPMVARRCVSSAYHNRGW